MASLSKVLVSALCLVSTAAASAIPRSAPDHYDHPAPGGNHTIPAPGGGNHTIPALGGNHTIPAPGGNWTAPTHTPGGSQPVPIPGSPTETPGSHPAPAPGAPTSAPCEEQGEDDTVPGVTPLPTEEIETMLFASTYWDVFPQRPSVAFPPAQGLHLESYKNLTQRETVAVFKNIPAEAKNCTFGFRAGSPDERVFISKLTGREGFSPDTISIARQLSGFPAQGTPISYDSINEFDTLPLDQPPQLRSRIDFNNWDDPGFESVTLVGNRNTLRCEETIYVKLSLVETGIDKHVYHQANEGEGLFVRYTV